MRFYKASAVLLIALSFLGCRPPATEIKHTPLPQPTKGQTILFGSAERERYIVHEAPFTATNTYDNVISRVTGDTPSGIDGLLRSTVMDAGGGGADFYLLNPNGILVGQNGSFDVPASLFLATADSLRLMDGNEDVVFRPAPYWNLTTQIVPLDDIVTIEVTDVRRGKGRAAGVSFAAGFVITGAICGASAKYDDDYQACLVGAAVIGGAAGLIGLAVGAQPADRQLRVGGVCAGHCEAVVLSGHPRTPEVEPVLLDHCTVPGDRLDHGVGPAVGAAQHPHDHS